MAETNSSPDLHDHMLKTYATLRLTLVAAGVALPMILLIGGSILGMQVQDSVSQYYHADRGFNPTENERITLTDAAKIKDALAKAHRDPTATEQQTLMEAAKLDGELFARPGAGELRDWFVGGLFIVGILLIVYKGFLPNEDLALNLAGVFAMGVALFHMPWGEPHERWDNHRSWIDDALNPLFHKLPWEQYVPSVHYVCALLLFICLGYVCFWCGSATLELPGDTGPERKGRALSAEEKTFLRWAYRGCGVFMASSVVLGPFVSHIPGIGFEHARVFVIEALGVVGFAAYWALKTWEIYTTGADRLAARNELEIVRSKSRFKGHKVRKREHWEAAG
jgi:hypothetical protein